MLTLNNKLINSVINLGIAESNTQLANTDKKIKVNNILNFMPQEIATLLREEADFLKEYGINITNPNDMIMCAVQVIISQIDLIVSQMCSIQDSLLGDRIAKIQKAQEDYKKYEIAHKNNENLEEYYLKQAEKNTSLGINELQNSFLSDIRTILDMPDEHVAILAMFPFLCKSGEKVSKVKDIDASNHRCKQTLAYIEQGYKLQLLVTMKLHGNHSNEYIEYILENFNNFLKNEVMSGNNLIKINSYDDNEKEFWLTEPKRMLEDINNFKDSLHISKRISIAIEENEEEFYEDEDYDDIEIL